MEVLILHYLLLRATNSSTYKGILYESQVYDNGKMPEYSIGFSGELGIDDLINIEIKTLVCDPFSKNIPLNIKDGEPLLQILTTDEEKAVQIKSSYSDFICLDRKDYYRQFNKNIKKIIEKFKGGTLLHSIKYFV